MTDIMTAATHPALQDENMAIDNKATDNVVRFEPPHAEIDAGSAEASGDNDDLDEALFDELDDAAAANVEDFRRRTKPCDEPVDGETLFAELTATFSRFLVLPPGADAVASLWVISTYAVHAANMRFSPRLMITAPGPNSGKTTMMGVLANLVRYPEPTSAITPASFFRLAVAKKTMLIDECDPSLPSRATTRNDLVAMLNMGHNRTHAVVERVETVNKKRIVVPYLIFGPVALSGIGDFGPATIKSRAFIFKLKPKLAHEQVEDFIPDEHAPMMRDLRSQIARWVIDNKQAIRECRPDLDRDLYNNRARDNSTTLLQIADAIGPVAAQRSREAIKALTRNDVLDSNALLLGDIASILTDPEVRVGEPPRQIGQDGFVFTSDLCNLLVEHFPDREAYAVGFNQARLAAMLRNFDIEPEQKRRGSQVLRAYRRDAFEEWFVRYGFAEFGEVAGSDVAASEPVAVAGGQRQQPSPPPPVAATPLHELFPNAHHEKPSKGDKKRAEKLCAVVGGCVRAGKVDASRVKFTSAFFWIVEDHDGRPIWAHLNGVGELDLLLIEAPGLVADNKAGIVINSTTTLCMAESDYQRHRALVNKARRYVLAA